MGILHAEWYFYTQSDISTRRVFFPQAVWFLLQDCDYNTYECDFNKHKRDFYTQTSVVLTRMSVIMKLTSTI
jgi:hypothetical protein